MIITVHAILRYLQRNLHVDVPREKANCAFAWRIKAPSDTQLLRYISVKFPKEVDIARSDIAYYCDGHNASFKQDDLTFIIRDNSVITIMEQA